MKLFQHTDNTNIVLYTFKHIQQFCSFVVYSFFDIFLNLSLRGCFHDTEIHSECEFNVNLLCLCLNFHIVTFDFLFSHFHHVRVLESDAFLL